MSVEHFWGFFCFVRGQGLGINQNTDKQRKKGLFQGFKGKMHARTNAPLVVIVQQLKMSVRPSVPYVTLCVNCVSTPGNTSVRCQFVGGFSNPKTARSNSKTLLEEADKSFCLIIGYRVATMQVPGSCSPSIVKAKVRYFGVSGLRRFGLTFHLSFFRFGKGGKGGQAQKKKSILNGVYFIIF